MVSVAKKTLLTFDVGIFSPVFFLLCTFTLPANAVAPRVGVWCGEKGRAIPKWGFEVPTNLFVFNETPSKNDRRHTQERIDAAVQCLGSIHSYHWVQFTEWRVTVF